MAKRQSALAATEHKIEEFAEDLSNLLGSARSKAEGWLGQRKAIATHLEEIRDTAAGLLEQLGHQAAGVVRSGRAVTHEAVAAVKRGPGRPKGPVKKKRTMSAEARARISAAQKKRWAKQKAADKK